MGVLFLGAGGCASDHAESHYWLADQLWFGGQAAAAIPEWNRVLGLDQPGGKYAQWALYRVGLTHFLELRQYRLAVEAFQQFLELAEQKTAVSFPQQKRLIQQVRGYLGELFFEYLEDYPQSIGYYQNRLRLESKHPEVPLWLFRLGKSFFFLFQFESALATFQDLANQYPKTLWAERALYEQGLTQLARDTPAACLEAILLFEMFIQTYPHSTWLSEARFGVASCLEEADRLPEALKLYQSLSKDYSTPQVIDVKVARIQERMSQKGEGSAKK